MKINYIQKLIKILENSTISEIEVIDFWGRKIRIAKSSRSTNPTYVTTPEAMIEETKKLEEKKAEELKKNWVAIKSPIVGTFYRAAAPDAPSYAEVGDLVKAGQVVCIVEAMKLMNEIESDVSGRVVKILVKNEDPVEYNQELFLIEPL